MFVVVIALAYGGYSISERRRKNGQRQYRESLKATVRNISNISNLAATQINSDPAHTTYGTPLYFLHERLQHCFNEEHLSLVELFKSCVILVLAKII